VILTLIWSKIQNKHKANPKTTKPEKSQTRKSTRLMKITRVHRESTRTLNLLFSKPKRSFPTRFLWPRYLPSLIFPWKERELRGKEKICLTAWGFRNFWIGYAQMGRQIRKTKTKASPEKSKADKKISRNPIFYFKVQLNIKSRT
jgi:hypothetical protein